MKYKKPPAYIQNNIKFIRYYAYMQEDDKYLYINKQLGNVFKEMRIKNTALSCNKAEEEYDIGCGNLNRLENGKTNPTFITLWKAAEAAGCKLSYIISLVETNVGDDFSLTD